MSAPRPVQDSDVVITMGRGDTRPVFPGKRYEDWDLDDPAGRVSRRCAPSATTSRRGVVALLGELDVPVTG